ncbi:probable protein phosphatase 2C 14 [Salvia miltiorrhiza]|uniref:probable protein phosphatase 2C 14 n=1 Tax=Salvia miltiorrhiza TaxID=226208 RepID=UPI0025AB9178|nr:probable protein phosphatase 2C 14 [Salvia miltiorrhiza]
MSSKIRTWPFPFCDKLKICQEMNDAAEIVGGPISGGGGSLKRKRPLKIEIPAVLSEIPVDVFKESDDPVCFADSDSGVGVYSLKGKKKFMEDSYKVFASANGDKRFFGVYDGHGGSKAAAFVKENLHLKIFEMLESISENKEKEAACKAGYLKTDEEFLKQGLDSGACCVTALIDGREMVVSNLGDCRAVLCMGGGSAEALTTDHRPTREEERRRIEDKGGYVEIHRGTWRVHGTLAVSRSIGDAHLKDWVMAEPDTKVVCLDPDMKYLVLASDGLWEEVSNEEAVGVVMQSCSSGKKQRMSHPSGRRMASIRGGDGSPPAKSRRISVAKQTKKMKARFPDNENRALNERRLLAACKKLADLAVDRGSLDDITVMIIDLNHYNMNP